MRIPLKFYAFMLLVVMRNGKLRKVDFVQTFLWWMLAASAVQSSFYDVKIYSQLEIFCILEEYSEQDYNENEEVESSSNALASGSEALGTSRTDVTGFSLESSVDGADLRISKRFSKSEQSEPSATATAPDASGSLTTTESNFVNTPSSERKPDNLPYLGIKTPNDEAIQKVRE